jgi:hypothetical protein
VIEKNREKNKTVGQKRKDRILFPLHFSGFTGNGANINMLVIRQGRENLQEEPFAARKHVSYRIEKKGTKLRFFANFDAQGWRQVGKEVQIRLAPDGAEAVARSHLRVLDVSGAEIRITADDFVW